MFANIFFNFLVLHTDFETRFEDVLIKEIPQWIINPYGDIEETDVMIQEFLRHIILGMIR